MSSFESFYAGRQGASFVIVKRFDAVSIEVEEGENLPQKIRYFAVERKENNEWIYTSNNNTNTPIERNTTNYNEYHWVATECGTTIKIDGYEGTGYKIPAEDQEGMVQCFKQGGATTNIVNYGEYVIIDGAGAGDINNPDNGKIYRRGMNYQGDFGGAEYIGQVVGPRGTVSDLIIKHYKKTEGEGYLEGSFKEGEEEDLVPGSYLDDGIRKFNDEIKYRFANIKDEYGNTGQYAIGFQIPYAMIDFEAISVDPHDNPSVLPDPDYYDSVNNKWEHPFYQKWNLGIPKGIHGVDSTNLRVVMEGEDPNNQQKALYYTSIDYSNSDDGETTNIRIGYLNDIKDIYLDSEGQLYVEYNDGTGNPICINYDYEQGIDNRIKWINSLYRGETQYDENVDHLYVQYNFGESVDLGNVRGEAGGIHIICNVGDIEELYDSELSRYLKPEEVGDEPNPDHAGWVVTVGPQGEDDEYVIYAYDYDENIWYNIGGLKGNNVYVAPAGDEAPSPFYDGHDIWLVTESMSFIE